LENKLKTTQKETCELEASPK